MRKEVALLFLPLAPALVACGTLLGIDDVGLAPNDASVSPGGGADGSGAVPPGDSGGTTTPESSTGPDDTGAPDDHATATGNDAGTATDASSTDADATTAACTEGGARCSGDYAVETCAANGQWGVPVDCPLAAPYCNAGACGICVASTTTCAGNGVETCDAGGWSPPAACANSACFNGACTGDCTPASTQCSPDAATTPQTCSVNGTWQNGAACAYVCADGGCTGTCTPGSVTCNGLQPQKCDDTGTWQNNGLPCTTLCTAGSCTGACSPGAATCSGLQPQRCSDAGAWLDNGGACPFVCDAGGCSGVCAPSSEDCSGSTPRTCNAGGEWQNGSPCTYVCDAGDCSGVCTPGAKECSGNGYVTCTPSGQWGTIATACSNSTCLDAGACEGVCASGATECADAGDGYVTCGANGEWGGTVTPCHLSACSGGACVGTCVPGSLECNSGNTGINQCNASGNWVPDTTCLDGEVCSNAACACPGGDLMCGSTCTNTQTDSLNCGTCGHSCLGATCAGGLCTPTTIAALYGGTFNFEFGIGIDSSNIYFTTGSDGRVGVCPLTGCTVINPSGGATIPTYIYTATGASLEQMLYQVSTGNIFISDSNNGVIYSITTAGSLNWTITGRTSPGFMATDGTNLYWAESSGLYAVPLADGTPVTSIDVPSSAPAAFGAWYDSSSGDLFSTFQTNQFVECPVGAGAIHVGGCTTGTSTSIGQPQEILVQGSTIFFGTQAQGVTNGGGVFFAPVSNPSQITALVAGSTGSTYDDVLGLTADANNIYFAPGNNNLYACALGGCSGTATMLVSAAGQVFQLATDAQYLYWGTTEKVMRVPK